MCFFRIAFTCEFFKKMKKKYYIDTRRANYVLNPILLGSGKKDLLWILNKGHPPKMRHKDNKKQKKNGIIFGICSLSVWDGIYDWDFEVKVATDITRKLSTLLLREKATAKHEKCWHK